MCGIAGIVYNDTSRNVLQEYLKRITDVIEHRGPDDEGFYISKNIGFGFRRLSIIDLSTGHQPMTNASGTITLVFNGEIYNYQELREQLIIKGYKFTTHSDTEVILHLYEDKGIECLKELRGMFAIAIWDSGINQLFCARDRLGIKPFFYSFNQQHLVFGSEIKQLLVSGLVSDEMDWNALDSYFAYGYPTADQSIYKNIHKLLPGHYFTYSPAKDKQLQIQRYWKPDFTPDYSKTEQEWEILIDTTLKQTLKQHMISDVPLGAFLSGGIDSSSVVALMSTLSPEKKVKTFSIGFKEQAYNELQFARAVAKKYNTDHHEMIVEPESIDVLSKLVKMYDEPFADSSAIPTYYVSKFAKQYVTVVLSGDGGDELFAGYSNYPLLNQFHQFNKYGAALRPLAKLAYHAFPSSIKGKGALYKLSKKDAGLPAYLTMFNEYERRLLLKGDVRSRIQNPAENYKLQLLSKQTATDYISSLQELDLATYLVDDILTKVDRASMYTSIETRVPLLDHKFVELALKIPIKYKLQGEKGKYILKKTMEKYLPQEVLYHKKQGFAIPLDKWFKDELKTYVWDTFSNRNNKIYNYLNKEYIDQLFKDHLTGNRNLGEKIWSILFFEKWLNSKGHL